MVGGGYSNNGSVYTWWWPMVVNLKIGDVTWKSIGMQWYRWIFHTQDPLKLIRSSLQLRWSGWGLAFCRYKVKKWGGGLYKITNKGQIRPCILYKIQASNPIFFSPRFLVVPSFWLYKIKNLGRILTNWPCLTPVCWHGCVPRKTIFGFCRGRRVLSNWSYQKPWTNPRKKIKGSRANQNHANPNSMKGHHSRHTWGWFKWMLVRTYCFFRMFLSRVGHGREWTISVGICRYG